jgi:hypothetical protein
MSQPLQRRLAALSGAVAAVLGALGLAAWYFLPTARQVTAPVSVTPASSLLGVAEGAYVFRSQGELQAAIPSAVVNVDFARQDLVRVVWQTDGYRDAAQAGQATQFGRLTCRSTFGGRRLNFFVHEPRVAGTVSRLFTRVIHEDWFAIPNGAQARLATPAGVARGDWLLTLSTAVLLTAATVAGLRAAGKQDDRL